MDLNKIESEFIRKSKLLALNPENHSELIKSENFLEMLVVSLASIELSIVRNAMETLHLLLNNRSNHSAICSTYGILEAVNLASERFMDSKMTHLAKDILCALTGPAYGTRSRKKKQQQLIEECEKSHHLMTKQIILHIHGLNSTNQTEIQELLILQRGIVSIHTNLDEQLCTLRVLKNISPRDLSKLIHTELKLEAKLVIRSDLQGQILLPLHDEDLPPYLPECDSPIRNKAVSMLGQWKSNASGVFQWFQKSFYW